MAPKDQTLVRNALEGQSQAFGELVDRYVSLVHGVVFEVVRRPDEVEDISQDVFCKAYEELGKLREPAKFGPWLSRMASNTALDWLRSSQVRRRSELQENVRLEVLQGTLPTPSTGQTPDQVLERSETEDALWEALDNMRADYRRVLILFHIEGCSYEQISSFLGISWATVKLRLYRAKLLLRKDLEGILFEEAKVSHEEKRQLKRKIMAALPFAVLAEFRPAHAVAIRPRWGGRLVKAGPAIGFVGLIGFAGYDIEQQWAAEEKAGSAAPWRVRTEEIELPGISVMAFPTKPQAGETVRLEFAGPDLEGGEENYAELHYITDPSASIDKVVPMRREGETWVAELRVPEGAKALFYYPTTEELGAQRLDWEAYLTNDRLIQNYSRGRLLYDDIGNPVRGSFQAKADMAERRGRPDEEVQALLETEIRRYPDNFEAQRQRLERAVQVANETPFDGDHDNALAVVEAEISRMEKDYGNRPTFAYWMAELEQESAEENYDSFLSRFPGHPLAERAARSRAMIYLRQRRTLRAIEALREMVENYPTGRLAHRAFRDMMFYVSRSDPKMALSIADSILAGDLNLLTKRATRSDPIAISAGVAPKAVSFCVKTELLLDQGKYDQAASTIREMVDSVVEDPFCYLYVGERLLGLDRGTFGNRPSYRREPTLALEVLEAGQPWANRDTLLGLLGYPPGTSDWRDDREQEVISETIAGFLRRNSIALAQAYFEHKQYYKALESLEALRERDHVIPEVPLWTDQEVYLRLGRVYSSIGRWAQARDAYERAREITFSHEEADSALQKIYRELGDSSPGPDEYPEAPSFELSTMDGGTISSEETEVPILLFYTDLIDPASNRWFQTLSDVAEKLSGKAKTILVSRSRVEIDFSQYAFVAALDDDAVADRYGPPCDSLFLVDFKKRLRLRLQCRDRPFGDPDCLDNTHFLRTLDQLVREVEEVDEPVPGPVAMLKPSHKG